jgi:hypothetical protein
MKGKQIRIGPNIRRSTGNPGIAPQLDFKIVRFQNKTPRGNRGVLCLPRPQIAGTIHLTYPAYAMTAFGFGTVLIVFRIRETIW